MQYKSLERSIYMRSLSIISLPTFLCDSTNITFFFPFRSPFSDNMVDRLFAKCLEAERSEREREAMLLRGSLEDEEDDDND